MTTAIKQFYWDTCVFIAHLADERDAYGGLIDDIRQFLDEAARGECLIHCSTITIAEITRANCKGGQDFDEFVQLFGGGIVPLSPDPNTMRLASELRSLIYTKTGGQRRLHTADAIHLASALTLMEAYGVSLDAFHTFDAGKRRDPEGKGVPLLGFDLWCEQCKDDPLAQRIINMTRAHPLHPAKEMDLGG